MEHFSLASWSPTGFWNIKTAGNAGNTQSDDLSTSYTPDTNLWNPQGSSDPNSSQHESDKIMPDASGNLIAFDDVNLDISFTFDCSDFDYRGSGKIAILYTPKNDESQSPRYTLGESYFSYDDASPISNIEQQVILKKGDILSPCIVPTGVTDMIHDFGNAKEYSDIKTCLVVKNITQSTDEVFYYGDSNHPPIYSRLPGVNLMQKGMVKNGQVQFILTQCGTPHGQAILQKIVNKGIEITSLDPITDPTLVPKVSWDPLPDDCKVLTAKVAIDQMGTTVFAPDNTYFAEAWIKGLHV